MIKPNFQNLNGYKISLGQQKNYEDNFFFFCQILEI